MEVEQLQVVEQVGLLQGLDRGEEFGDGQAKFRLGADGAAPASGAAAGELGSDPDKGCGAQLLAGLDDPFDLVGLLDHDHRLAAEASGEDGRLDVALILVAVADQQRLGVIHQGEGDQQFRLAAGLQTEVPALAAGHELLDDMALLVALHGEDPLVATGVAVLSNGALKGGVQSLEPVFEDVVEADQQGEPEAATFQALDEIQEIQAAAPLPFGLHADVAAGVDREIGIPPAVDAVEGCAVGRAPAGVFSGDHRAGSGAMPEI